MVHFVVWRCGVLRRGKTGISEREFLDAFGRYSNYRKVQNHLTVGKMVYKLF